MDRTEMMNYLAVIERIFYGQRSGITAARAIAHIEALEAENAALKALLAGKVLCDQQSIAAISTSSGEVVATLDAAYFGTNWTPLYAPASLAGNADVGTMRIVAIQGAAEEYARQGNAVIDNQLWDKFGKEGGE
jgi:hypothetical protein